MAYCSLAKVCSLRGCSWGPVSTYTSAFFSLSCADCVRRMSQDQTLRLTWDSGVSLAPSLSEFVNVTPHGFPPVEAAPLDILCFVFSSLRTAPYDSTVFSSCDLRIGNVAERVKWIDSVVSLLGVSQLWH